MNKKVSSGQQSDKRINFMLILFLIGCAVFIVRLFKIQVIDHNEFKALAQEQYWDLQEIPAKRGDILSKDGYPLATTQVSYMLYLEPKKIGNKSEVASLLGKKLGEFNKFDIKDPAEFHTQKILEALNKDLYWVRLINNLTPEERRAIEDLNLVGIGFEEESLRYYPEHNLAAHVLGFVASDEKGQKKGYFGVEGSFNGDLEGKPGRVVEEQDALGAPILVGGYTRIDPIDGRNVVLTIDRGVQYIVEKYLQEGVIETDAKSGTVIVMEPFTGDVIALANYPTFDPENFNDFGREEEDSRRKAVERRNHAISYTYEPGSVIKALTISAAIDLGKVTPESTFVDVGPVQYSDYTIDNWDGKHHGTQTVIQLLQKSNNIGAAWAGHLVGAQSLSDYFRKFGLGSISGIDMEGEDTGVIHPPESWTSIDLATASFGQGISATPLQVINAFNAIANGGVLMRPRIVEAVIDDGKEITIPIKEVGRVISPETSDIMVDLLTLTAAGGEAKYFNIKNFHIAGKTGTAQIPVGGKYDPKKTNATFVGFLSGSKRYTMLVKLEEPTSSTYAAETAVPLWMSITDELVKYYGIVPDKSPEEE